MSWVMMAASILQVQSAMHSAHTIFVSLSRRPGQEKEWKWWDGAIGRLNHPPQAHIIAILPPPTIRS